jgi:hypothetical protein
MQGSDRQPTDVHEIPETQERAELTRAAHKIAWTRRTVASTPRTRLWRQPQTFRARGWRHVIACRIIGDSVAPGSRTVSETVSGCMASNRKGGLACRLRRVIVSRLTSNAFSG